MLCTLLLDTESSVAGFLVLILWSFWKTVLSCWSNTWVTDAVGQPELHALLSPALSSQNLKFMKPNEWKCYNQQNWHHIHCLPLVDVCYWIVLCHKKFNNSPVFKMQSLYHATPLWWPCVHVQENVLFCCPAVGSRTSKINHRKNCRHFLLILTSVVKLFGQPSYNIHHSTHIFFKQSLHQIIFPC